MSALRKWTLRVCLACPTAVADAPCAGFPGAWNEDRDRHDRGSCLAEIVEVQQIPTSIKQGGTNA